MKSDQTPDLLSTLTPSGVRTAKLIQTFGFWALDGFKGCGARVLKNRSQVASLARPTGEQQVATAPLTGSVPFGEALARRAWRMLAEGEPAPA